MAASSRPLVYCLGSLSQIKICFNYLIDLYNTSYILSFCPKILVDIAIIFMSIFK
jgi:hypothetical protein